MSSRSLNKVTLIGNLTRDPELRYTPQGTAVCSFGLATNRSWVPSEGGERREETEFHRIVAWNKLAELCSQLLAKGRKVYVEGRLQTRSWQTPDGQTRTATEIVIDDMIILDSRKFAPVSPEATTEAAVPEVKEPATATETEAEKTEEPAPKAKKEKKKEAVTVEKEEKKEEAAEGEDINVDEIPF